jgi:sugar transferase EpsL
MGVITLLVSWRMSAPALFLQERPSLQGKPFNLCQFRSITTTRDPHGQLLPDVQRFTPLGQLLSGWSLNKLSELINVVKGEMSLVGPRPLLIKCLNRYNPEQMRRHDMKPSITGWCRVNGRDAISWEKFALDVGFVDNWPLGFDLQILALTAWNSLLWEEISQSVHATIEKFRGSRD